MAVDADRFTELPPFERLKPASRQQLAQFAVSQTVKAGHLLYGQGDPPTGLYVLEAGCVVLYRQSKEKSQILTMVLPGECFGGESLPNETPSPYTAKAVVPSMLLYIEPTRLREMLAVSPDVLACFLGLVSFRLRQLTVLVHDLAFRDVASRLAGVLLMLAESQGETTDEGLRVQRVFSQADVAAMVGTAREVISRTLKQFENDGILQKNSREYLILDVEALSHIATQEAR